MGGTSSDLVRGVERQLMRVLCALEPGASQGAAIGQLSPTSAAAAAMELFAPR